MLKKLKKFAGQTKDRIVSTAVHVADLNGDGKVDQGDAKIAAEWTKNTASTAVNESAKLGKNVLRSDMIKDAAAGAAICAVIAVPVPLIGPLVGAAIGAGLGLYVNMMKRSGTGSQPKEQPKDLHVELINLEDLRQKNILTDAEFEIEKKKLLRNT